MPVSIFRYTNPKLPVGSLGFNVMPNGTARIRQLRRTHFDSANDCKWWRFIRTRRVGGTLVENLLKFSCFPTELVL